MSTQSAFDWDPEFANRARAGADTRPPPGFFDLDWDATKAAAGEAAMDVPGRSHELRRGEMAAAAAELAKMTGRNPTEYYYVIPGAPVDAAPYIEEERFWRDLTALRRVKPDALQDLGVNQADYDRKRVARLRAGSQDRQTRMGRQGLLGNLAGGMAGAMTDPINIMTMPVGGGGKTAAMQILRNGLLNMGIEAVETPLIAVERAAQGREMTAQEAGYNIALAGLGGAGLTALGKSLPVAARGAKAVDDAAYRALAPVRAKIDPLFLDRDLARALRAAVPDHALSPDEAMALHVLERAAEVDETSPYVRTLEGLNAHADRIDATIRELVTMPEPRPIVAPVAAAPVAGSFDSENALRFILKLEGGSQLVTDSGGLTKYGISAKGNPGVDIANLTEGQALDIYRRKYLAVLPLEGRSKETALVALDASVNHGPAFARKLLAQAGDDPARMIALRRAEYARLIAEDPGKYAQYGKGWENRLQQVEAQVGLRAGEAGTADAPPVGEAVGPVLRPDALDAERPAVTFGGRELPIASFTPSEIGVDAELMQFKSGGDAAGVTERLQGVREWDPMAAGMVTVWEANDGRRLIADGHQRLGLANRLLAADPGQDIRMNAFVLREADGFSARDARVLTALKNIGEGTGSSTDAAKVFREAGLDPEEIFRRLPPRSALVRDGKALARLSDEAFGAVVNGVIPESHAAAIGALADDPATHMGLVQVLAEADPPNRAQADMIVRQAIEAGFRGEEQVELFGTRATVSSLFAQRAKVLDRTLAELRRLKGAFGVAARNADALDAAGNRIDVAASEAAAQANAMAVGIVDRLALRKGNAVNEILNDAAQRLADGEPIGRVVQRAVAELRQLDLDAALRGTGDAVDAAGGSGRAGEPDGEAGTASAADEPSPASLDELEAAGQGGFGFFDEAAHKGFDDPAGDGATAAAESVWHDLRADIDPNLAALQRQKAQMGAEAAMRAKIEQDGTMGSPLFDAADQPLFDLEDGKGARSIADIDAELKADEAAIAAIRACQA